MRETFARKAQEQTTDPDALGEALIDAVKHGKTSRAAELVDAGADVNYRGSNGMTPMHHAVAHGARACIRFLINTGKVDHLVKDDERRLASDIAHEWGNQVSVGRLLSRHARRQARALNVPQSFFRLG